MNHMSGDSDDENQHEAMFDDGVTTSDIGATSDEESLQAGEAAPAIRQPGQLVPQSAASSARRMVERTYKKKRGSRGAKRRHQDEDRRTRRDAYGAEQALKVAQNGSKAAMAYGSECVNTATQSRDKAKRAEQTARESRAQAEQDEQVARQARAQAEQDEQVARQARATIKRTLQVEREAFAQFSEAREAWRAAHEASEARWAEYQAPAASSP